MKFKFTLLLVVLNLFAYSQTNSEIASVYLNRAEAKYIEKDMEGAMELFNKAMKYTPEITQSRTAKLGMLLNFEFKDYPKAKIFGKQYFNLELNKETDDYMNMLDTFVSIQEAEEEEKKELERQEKIRLAQEKAQRQRDSLTVIWNEKSSELTFKANNIKSFNENGIAIFKQNDELGLVDDRGNVVLQPSKYSFAKESNNLILLFDKEENPTKISIFNTITKEEKALPNVSSFNLSSTHFGKVLEMRNHILVTYPNNSDDVLMFDLNKFKQLNDKITEERLKILKKEDAIDKYDDDELTIKKDGEWYKVGSHLGGGIYPLFNENKQLFGYLLAANGKILLKQSYNSIGYFVNGKAQVQNANKTFYIDQNGMHYDSDDRQIKKYSGTTEVKKLNDGSYQFFINENGKQVIILGDKKLPLLKDFLDSKVPN